MPVQKNVSKKPTKQVKEPKEEAKAVEPVSEEQGGEEKQPQTVEPAQPPRLSEIEEILLPNDLASQQLDGILQEIANEAVNGVVSSVVGLIKKGELQQHVPTKAWGAHNTDQERRERVLAQKRYNRIQRLLIQAENGQIDAQKELMKINQQLDRDHLSGVSAEDIILEDLAALIKAKEDRKKELEFKRQLKDQKKKEKLREEKLRAKRQRDMDEQMFRMRELEERFLERQKKDQEEKARRQAEKEAERKKEKQMQRQLKKAAVSRLGSVPLYKKMERNYDKKVVIPELEQRKKYLAQVRNDMRNPHYVEIAEHEAKMREWENGERNRLAEMQVPSHEIPAEYQAASSYKEQKRRLAEEKAANKAAIERKKREADKKRKFAQKVQREHKPQVDPEKVAEMEMLAMDVDKQRAQAMRQRGEELMKNSAKEYLSKGTKAAVNDTEIAQIKRKHKKKQEEGKKEEKKPVKNYLDEMKQQRKTKAKKKETLLVDEDLTPREFAEKAAAKERAAEAAFKSGEGNVDTAAAASEMYIDVINAKLKMLEDS